MRRVLRPGREGCRLPSRDRPGHESRGTAAVELVIFLALVVCSALCVWRFTGDSAKRAFDGLATHLATGTDPSDARAGKARPHSPQSDTSETATSSRASRAIWVAAWSASLGVGYLGWCLIRRRRRRKGRPPTQHRRAEDVLPDSLPADQRNRLFEKRHLILRILSRKPMDLLKNRIKVRQLMTPNPLAVRPDTPVKKLAEAMASQALRHLLVCDEAGRLLGIVSDHDVDYRSGKTAADLMTPNPIVVSPQTAVGPVITMLLNEHISCVPVVDNGTLCGILTTSDLLMSLQCAFQILDTLATEMRSPSEPQEAAAT